ncbi:MAG: hypothetical protein ACRD50_13240 [Candidatus Acidiferrales bacterium]
MFELSGPGLAERDISKRYLAVCVTAAILLASVAAILWFFFRWALWLAIPLSLIVLAMGLAATFWIVGRILPKKIPTARS